MTAARSFTPRPARNRRGLFWTAGAVALGLALASGADAQDSEDSPFLQEPPTLPQAKNGVIRPGDQPRLERVDRITEVFRALQACWKPPAGGGYSGQELTVQFAFKRSGEVLGKPKITYYKAGTAPDQREAFADAVRATFVNCTPLPFTEKLGAAIAGQLFTIRFIDAPRT